LAGFGSGVLDTEDSRSAPNPQPVADLWSIKQLKSASDLVKKLKVIKRSRQRLEREWKLNLAFFKGNQWVFYNRFSGRIESLPTDDGDKPRYRIRLASNQILPGCQAYAAQLTKTKPVITATPDSGSDRDIKAAQMAEDLYEHWWREFSMKSKLQQALVWTLIGGKAYWRITWDAFAGKSATFLLDPHSGQPITNPYLADMFKQQLAQQAPQQAQQILGMLEKTVPMGEVRVDVLSPFSVYEDPTVQNFEDAQWVFIRMPMSPDEIEARWGVRLRPDAVPADPDIAMPFTSAEDKTEPTVRNVYCGYFKPNATMPKGRIVWFTEGPDKILEDGPWTFPTNDLPLVKFPGVETPGTLHDEALVTHARPLQKELNRTLSQVVEHKNLTLKPQMLAPIGSLSQRLTNEPGAVFEFNPVNGIVPQWRDMPSLPPYVFEHLQEIQMRIDRLFNLQAITRGDVPPNVEAGVAIDLLQEAAVDQVAPTIQRMEEALALAGHLMVALAQQYYSEPRLLKVYGEGGSVQARQFLNADIKGAFNFHAEAGSGLPRTRAGRMARIEQLVSMQVMRPDQAAKYLDLGDLKGISAMMASDEDQAYREHEKLLNGQPINAIAQQEATRAVMQGLNPQTGQPLQPQDGDPQQIVHDAGLKPLAFENFQQHLETHSLFMKSPEFEGLPLNIQDDFIQHFIQTLQTWRSLPVLPEPQAVRTSLHLAGTVDPSTAAEILNRSGVLDASPQNLTQPPLETYVREDLDKEQVSPSGNMPMQLIDAIHQEELHWQDQQQAHQDAQAAVEQAQLSQAAAIQKVQHAHAQHAQKMRHAEEKHQAGMQQKAAAKNGG
jgi:hypothetical protein